MTQVYILTRHEDGFQEIELVFAEEDKLLAQETQAALMEDNPRAYYALETFELQERDEAERRGDIAPQGDSD